MSKIDKHFLRQAEREGWIIESVSVTSCVAKCGVNGCSMRALLRAGGKIPPRVVPDAPSFDQVLQSFDTMRVFLRDRREELRLSIRETEEVSGIADDYVAKFEKDPTGEDRPRVPSVTMAIHWANALGYDLVLRPRPLPAITANMLVETRHRAEARGRRNKVEAMRRSG